MSSPSSPQDPPGGHGREHERFPVDWRVTLKCPDWKFVSKVALANASRGGLFVLTPRPPDRGSQIELVIELPNGARLPLRGVVKHVLSAAEAQAQGRGPGVGVRLDDESAAKLKDVERMLLATSEQPAAETPGAEAPAAEFADEPSPAAAAQAPSPSPSPESPGFAPPRGKEAGLPDPEIKTDQGTGRMRTATMPPPPWERPKGDIAPIVGIDFGTSYSSVSVAIGDHVHIVPDDQNRSLVPSVVSYPTGGDPVMGWDARARIIRDPRSTISSMKRFLGRSYRDKTVAGLLHAAAYKTLEGPSESILVEVAGTQLAVPQVCAKLIEHVVKNAESKLGVPIKQAVMSIPVSFTETEKTALRRAAQLAGIEVVGLVEEPVAAALTYGFGQQKNEIVAVYDFGGGTFDFTVLDMSGDHFRVLACEGDPWLGGDDFDFTLASAVADAFWRATKVELRQRQVEWQRLVFACEKAKRSLTTSEETYISVPKLIEHPKRIDLHQKLTRQIFERLVKEHFERSLSLCASALKRVGLDPFDVTQVVMSGGVSRIPFVQRGLAQFFERELTTLVNPDEAICLGAGVRAAQLADHECKGVYRAEDT